MIASSPVDVLKHFGHATLPLMPQNQCRKGSQSTCNQSKRPYQLFNQRFTTYKFKTRTISEIVLGWWRNNNVNCGWKFWSKGIKQKRNTFENFFRWQKNECKVKNTNKLYNVCSICATSTSFWIYWRKTQKLRIWANSNNQMIHVKW